MNVYKVFVIRPGDGSKQVEFEELLNSGWTIVRADGYGGTKWQRGGVIYILSIPEGRDEASSGSADN